MIARVFAIGVAIAIAGGFSRSASESERATVPAQGVPGPIVQRKEDTYEVVIPQAMQDALLETVPDFEPFTLSEYGPDIERRYQFTMRQAPWAAIGDFNADGYTDLIIDGRSSLRSYRFCVWGNPVKPQVLTLMQSGPWPSTPRPGEYLRFAAPGRRGTNYSEERLDLFTDAFEGIIYEKAATLYYWEDGRFKEFATAD